MERFHNIICLILSILVAIPAQAQIDVNGQLKNAQLQILTSAPTAANAKVYFHDTNNEAMMYNGSSWEQFLTTGLFTTKGDVVVWNGTDVTRLGAGSNGQVLSADSAEATGLKWINAATNPMDSDGDLIVGGSGGAATKFDHPSTANRVLRTATTTTLDWGQIVNDDVSGSAAIAGSKIVAAANGVAGAVSTASQDFSGLKTFLDGLIPPGSATGKLYFIPWTATYSTTNMSGVSGTPTVNTAMAGRIGNFVIGFIRITMTATGDDINVVVPFSVPVASTFANGNSVIGSVSTLVLATGVNFTGHVDVDTTNSLLRLRFRGSHTSASRSYTGIFAYEVI
jgi:hypothetical protein